jgi:hypothetical protein
MTASTFLKSQSSQQFHNAIDDLAKGRAHSPIRFPSDRNSSLKKNWNWGSILCPFCQRIVAGF